MSQTCVTRNKAIGYDAKTMAGLKLDNDKSPMDKLSEILKRSNKKDVVYEVLNVKKSSYGNTYVIKASNGEITAIGQGTIMSTAKTNAALNLLSQIYDDINNPIQIHSNYNDDQLPSIDDRKSQIETVFNKSKNSIISSINDFNDSSSKNIKETIFCNICHSTDPENQDINETIFCNICHSPSPDNENPAENNSTIFLEINCIDLLQEFCIAHCLQLPEYSFSQEIVEQCSISFTVICSFLIFKTSGKENSKQLAKRYAAYEMYLCIKNQSELKIDSFKEKGSNYKSSRESLMSINKASFCLLSSKSMERLEMFLSKTYLSGKIPVDILDSIAKDEGFSVSYIDISNKLGDYIVLVQLLIDSVLVCVGSGKTMINAKCSAIYSMLKWLQSTAKQSLQKIE